MGLSPGEKSENYSGNGGRGRGGSPPDKFHVRGFWAECDEDAVDAVTRRDQQNGGHSAVLGVGSSFECSNR